MIQDRDNTDDISSCLNHAKYEKKSYAALKEYLCKLQILKVLLSKRLCTFDIRFHLYFGIVPLSGCELLGLEDSSVKTDQVESGSRSDRRKREL